MPDTQLELLEQIVRRLDRIETVLQHVRNNNRYNNNTNFNESKRIEAKQTRELMQDIVEHYKKTEPFLNIDIGTKLHIFRFRDTIAKIKNIKNTNFEHRRIIKLIRKLEEYQFVIKDSADMIQVLDTGKDWSQLQ